VCGTAHAVCRRSNADLVIGAGRYTALTGGPLAELSTSSSETLTTIESKSFRRWRIGTGSWVSRADCRPQGNDDRIS
jgi:hypothetical protein